MRRLENFCRAWRNLTDIRHYEEPYGPVELAGMVALFQICFEQAWKAMKERLEAAGFSEGKTGSPKLILKTAYSAGMIRDEQLWLSALEARNNASYAYNEAIAREIVEDVRARYIDMFAELKKELEENRRDA